MPQPVARQRQIGRDRQLDRFVQLGLGALEIRPPLGAVGRLLGEVAIGSAARRGDLGDPLVVLLAGVPAVELILLSLRTSRWTLNEQERSVSGAPVRSVKGHEPTPRHDHPRLSEVIVDC